MAQLTDVVSISRAKSWFSIHQADITQDDVLAAAITAASQWLDVQCGPVIQRTITGEVLQGGDAAYVQVRRRPVVSFTSVVEYESAVATTLTAETETTAGTYLAEPWAGQPTGLYSGRLFRRSGFLPSKFAGPVKVTYVAGRYATTAAAQDSRFELAGFMAAAWLMRSQVLRVAQPQGDFDIPGLGGVDEAPPAIRELLADEWQTTGSEPRAEGRVGSIRLGLWSEPETEHRTPLWGAR